MLDPGLRVGGTIDSGILQPKDARTIPLAVHRDDVQVAVLIEIVRLGVHDPARGVELAQLPGVEIAWVLRRDQQADHAVG